MDERLHPFKGFASAYQVLCDLADEKGWTVRLRFVNGQGNRFRSDVCEEHLSCGRQLQLELHTSFGRLPVATGEVLDELANEILEKVIA